MKLQFTNLMQLMPGWEQLGMQAATDAVNGIFGIAVGNYNDQRQRRQQQALQNIQIEGNKAMIDYQMQKQLEMWRNTNYSAQKEEMKKAGLNPALMYGMSGGGGTTTGSASGSVTGASAPVGGGEMQGILGLQRGMLQAQIANINADTRNKNVDANNKDTGGVINENIKAGTAQALASVQKLIAETQNEGAKWDLMRVELAIKRLNEYELSNTVDFNIETVSTQLDIAKEELKQATTKTKYDQSTVDEMIKQLNTTGIYLTLRNALTKALTSNTTASTANVKQDTKNKEAQESNINADTGLKWMQTEEGRNRIKKMAADIAQAWQGLRIDEQRMYIQRQLADIQNTKLSMEMVDRIISQIDKMVGFKFSK